MKNITAYFSDNASARAAAYDISEGSFSDSEIKLSSLPSDAAGISNYTYTGIFLGASVGLILGTGAALIPEAGFFAKAGIITGLISGSVIGAVTGTLLDILTYDNIPTCSSLSVSVDKKDGGIISKKLKKRGAVKVVIGESN